MTQTEYAKHSGLSQGYISALVKQGMPMHSPEAADAWRGTSKGGNGRGPKKAPTPQPTAVEQEGPYRPPDSAQPVDTSVAAEDTAQGAYERQKQIERASYDLAVKALRGGQLDSGRLVSVHAQAAKNLVACRQDVLDLAEREKRLVSGDWVRKVMQDHDGSVASLLKSMPKQLAGRIAPHDPEHAERELNRWVQEVALKTLHNTDPWKA
ncbi:MAG: hypothetical protein RL442_2295 [Pseudomonadota bacterium]|jgi:hypothetical protein